MGNSVKEKRQVVSQATGLRGNIVLEHVYLCVQGTTRSWTAREVADEVGVTEPVAARALKKLNQIKMPVIDVNMKHKPYRYYTPKTLWNLFGWTEEDNDDDVGEVETLLTSNKELNKNDSSVMAIGNV